MKEQMRQSPLIHANETGWRENGQNGYPWAFPTAREQGIRYYEYDHSRKQAVAARILVPSEGQPGATWLISDFYCCYNDCARPKPCWLCLQGAVHYLKEEQAQDRAVLTWAGDVAAVRAAVERMTPTTEAGQTKVRCTLAYLTEHSHRLGYPELWWPAIRSAVGRWRVPATPWLVGD